MTNDQQEKAPTVEDRRNRVLGLLDAYHTVVRDPKCKQLLKRFSNWLQFEMEYPWDYGTSQRKLAAELFSTLIFAGLSSDKAMALYKDIESLIQEVSNEE